MWKDAAEAIGAGILLLGVWAACIYTIKLIMDDAVKIQVNLGDK